MLNNCVQSSTAFLGPALTIGKTGNIYQGGLTYGSNKIISNHTGKTPTEHLKTVLTALDIKLHSDEFTNSIKKTLK